MSEGDFAAWRWKVYRRGGEAIIEADPGETLDPTYERLPEAPGRGRDATGLLESVFRLENLVVSGTERMRLDRAVEAGVTVDSLVQIRRDDLGISLRRDRFPTPVPAGDAAAIPADPASVVAGLKAALTEHAPRHPGGVRLDCVAAAGILEITARPWQSHDGWVPWAPPAEISQWLHRLRTITYTPGHGAWLSLTCTLAPGQDPVIAYDCATRPKFHAPHAEPRCWHDELRLLPRTAEATPDWMLGQAWRHHASLADVHEAPRPLRLARMFDGVAQDTGRPYTCRPAMGALEYGRVRYYLENAPVAVEAEEAEACHHTDGVWVWPRSMVVHVEQSGLVPPLELLDHIRGAAYVPPAELPDETLREAAALAAPPPGPERTPAQDDGDETRDDGRKRAIEKVRQWLRAGTTTDMTTGPHAVDIEHVHRSPEGWTVQYNSVRFLTTGDRLHSLVPVPSITVRDRDGALRRPAGWPMGDRPSSPVPDRTRETWAEDLDPAFRDSGVAYLGIPDQAVRRWLALRADGSVSQEARANPAAGPGPAELGLPEMTTKVDHLLSYLEIGWFTREQFLIGLLANEILIPVGPGGDMPLGSMWRERPRRIKAFSSPRHLPQGTARWLVLDGVAFLKEFAGVGISLNPDGRPSGEVTAEELRATHAEWPWYAARTRRCEDADGHGGSAPRPS